MADLPIAIGVEMGMAVANAAILDNFDDRHRANSMVLLHTSAATPGAEQKNPDACLGGNWSSTYMTQLGHFLYNPIPGIQVLEVSGANGLGLGLLTAPTVDTLSYRSPTGTAGPSVTIANGETKAIESGTNPGAWVIVTRTSANDLGGTCVIDIREIYNNGIGASNPAQSAIDKVRALAYRNESYFQTLENFVWIATLGTNQTTDTAQLPGAGSGTIEVSGDFTDWDDLPQKCGFAHIKTAAGATREVVYYTSRTDTVLTVPAGGRAQLGTAAGAGAADDDVYPVPGMRIGFEVPVAGAIQVVGDEDTLPAAINWSIGITAATGLDLGTIMGGSWRGIWERYDYPATMTATPRMRNQINWGYLAQ